MAAASDRNVSAEPRNNAPYSTRRGKNFLKLLIEKNIIRPQEPVFYKSRKNDRKEGRITDNGIVCNCCGQMFSLTGFGSHAGCKKHRPSSNIFLEDGRSIADCLLELKPAVNNAAPIEHDKVQEEGSIMLFGKRIFSNQFKP